MIPVLFNCKGSSDDIAAVRKLTERSAFSLKGICIYTENGAEEITDFAKKLQIPVAFGAGEPLMMKENHTYSYGNSKRRAVDLIKDFVQANDNAVIVSDAPLTNIAAFLLCYPHMAEKIKCIAIAGGSIYSGNSTPCAEKNIYDDPEAAQIVISSSAPVVLFPLEATRGSSNTLMTVLCCLIDATCADTVECGVEIELESSCSRGCSIVDLFNKRNLKKIKVVTKTYVEKLNKLLESGKAGK